MGDEEEKTIDVSTEPVQSGEKGEPKQATGDALSGINRLLSEEVILAHLSSY